MRIAMIGARGLPSLYPVGGGVETHVENLARHLVIEGHEVTVYVRKYANPKRRKTLNGIRIISIPSINTKHLDTISHVFLSSLHALTEPFDICHYHGIGPSTLAWIPRLFKRDSKVVVTFHSRDQFHEKWGILARLYLIYAEWTAIYFPHVTIAVSHGIQLLCKKLHPKSKVYYIPNGVDEVSRQPGTNLIEKMGLEPNRYFLQLARIVPHKAQDDTIHAFRMAHENFKLVIAGSASYDDTKFLEKLERLAQHDARIMLIGHQSGEVLHQLIAHCRALIHPSRSEGLSVVILEAMSYGRMVIMSDIPENLELIDHSGTCFPAGNIEELAKTIQWAMDDPAAVAERGKRGQEIIRRLYSWDAVVRKIVLAYQLK